MIGSLRGELLERSEEEVLVEVAGLGYRVTVTPATSAALGQAGNNVFLHVVHHVREDTETLFGFPSIAERRTFEALLGAHQVGPALALAILSMHTPGDLATILATDDLESLKLVPGVGPKTATRLLVELKSQLDLGDVTSAVTPTSSDAAPSSLGEVRRALSELGYSAEEIRDAVASLPADEQDVSVLLKAALGQLAAKL